MKHIRTILSPALALLVLVSSTNFIVGYHLCGGRVQNVSVFTKAEGCPMEQLPPCHRTAAKSCCADEEIFHAGEEFKSTAISFDVASPFVGEMTTAPLLIAQVIDTEAPFYSNVDYHPPLPKQDLTVSLQVFLI